MSVYSANESRFWDIIKKHPFNYRTAASHNRLDWVNCREEDITRWRLQIWHHLLITFSFFSPSFKTSGIMETEAGEWEQREREGGGCKGKAKGGHLLASRRVKSLRRPRGLDAPSVARPSHVITCLIGTRTSHHPGSLYQFMLNPHLLRRKKILISTNI